MIRIGNFLYFLPILVLIALLFLSDQLCKRLGKEFARKYILILLWSNFVLHFLKQFLPSYLADFPNSLKESTIPNFCACLIVIEPFIFMSENRYLKDYCYYVGILSAIAAYLYPPNLIGLDLSRVENFFEAVRYYSCHAPLLICGYLMVRYDQHKLDYHRLWALPLTMTGINIAIVLNGLFLHWIGFPGYPQNIDEVISRSGPLAGAACFGPPLFCDSFMGWLYPYTIPGLMHYYDSSGVLRFTPSLWMLLPEYIALLIVGPLMAYPFQKREMRMDYEAFRQKQKMRKRRKTSQHR